MTDRRPNVVDAAGQDCCACRLCASRSRFTMEVRGSRLFTCEACGYLQVDPLPSEDTLRTIYGEQYFAKSKYRNDEAQILEQSRRARLLDKAGLPRGQKVLDFGCATGLFLEQIKDRYTAYGCDYSQEAIDLAKDIQPDLEKRLYASSPANVLPDDLPELDAITAWDVVEHLGDPVGTLERLASQLRPGGILALSTPDNGALTAKLLGRRWAFMTPPEHLGFFNIGNLRRLFERLGLKVEFSVSQGKWANSAFILYKARRVFPELIPQSWVDGLSTSWVGRRCLYVPTFDVLYVVARKTSHHD
jgi:SAM-dependent methyltransferase